MPKCTICDAVYDIPATAEQCAKKGLRGARGLSIGDLITVEAGDGHRQVEITGFQVEAETHQVIRIIAGQEVYPIAKVLPR
ncbi:MAG: hypothetical protein WCV85_02550 [Patescibacteria group bacterium]|jgi:hypothetical protein